MNNHLWPLEVREGITAPEQYWCCRQDFLDQVTNGCGPGGWKFDLVPDRILGLSIHQVCDIHDWCYYWGETDHDKEFADKLFLYNLIAHVKAHSNFITEPIRLRRALFYHEAVSRLGDRAFWANKERDGGQRCSKPAGDIQG